MTKFKVNIQNEEGQYLLREIKGLKEGDVIEGRISSYNKTAVEFKWNGEDAVLWIGCNCVEFHERKRLPKGWQLNVMCWARNIDNACLECSDTKQSVIEAMKERGYSRNEYEIIWVVRDYNMERDFEGQTEGIGDTRAEAISDFWMEYNK